MRKILLTSLLVLMTALAVTAQDETPKAEVFGGYSYPGGSFHGWNASVTGNINKWFSLVADFTGHYGSEIDEDGFNEKENAHSYLFGPRFSVRKKRAMPFAHALLGASTLRTELTGFGQRFFFSDTSFAVALGGGLDIKVNDHIAIRAVQLDYLRTGFFNETQNKGRLAFGIVFRFGKK